MYIYTKQSGPLARSVFGSRQGLALPWSVFHIPTRGGDPGIFRI